MILDEIMQRKRAVHADRPASAMAEARAAAKDAPPTRPFRKALESAPAKPALIAEVKRRSPARGADWPGVDPVALAAIYESAGASALSVLTDGPDFGGSPADLVAARGACTLATLRKDFTVSELDVVEARAMGADAVLLIVRGLDDSELAGFGALAGELGMAALFEVHDEAEADRALLAEAKLVGVNNRDLATFETTLGPSLRVLPRLPHGVLRVSESAIHSAEHVRAVREAGADAVLVGTAFCSSPEPGARVREVMGWKA